MGTPLLLQVPNLPGLPNDSIPQEARLLGGSSFLGRGVQGPATADAQSVSTGLEIAFPLQYRYRVWAIPQHQPCVETLSSRQGCVFLSLSQQTTIPGRLVAVAGVLDGTRGTRLEPTRSSWHLGAPHTLAMGMVL